MEAHTALCALGKRLLRLCLVSRFALHDLILEVLNEKILEAAKVRKQFCVEQIWISLREKFGERWADQSGAMRRYRAAESSF